MSRPTALLIGCHGQVGFELVRALLPRYRLTTAAKHGADISLDLTNPAAAAAQVRRLAPDVVVNAAAYTAVDRAQSEGALADTINAHAPTALAQVCAEIGALLVHFSTDYVFDGLKVGAYQEDDACAPASRYGQGKLAGEHGIRASGCAHLIFRLQWVYAARGQNFLRTMLRLADKPTLSIVNDQIGAPTPARWIAATVAAALGRTDLHDLRRTFHLSAAGSTTWFDFANAIFAGASARGLIQAAPTLQPISTAAYAAPAPRPLNGRLDLSRPLDEFGLALPDWSVGLEQTLDELMR